MAPYNEQALSVVRRACENAASLRLDLKWTRKLKKSVAAGRALGFDTERVVEALYRPFNSGFSLLLRELNEDWYQP